MSRRLRFLFFVNGEGRGHLAQAAAVAELLAEAGHALIGVHVGEGGEDGPTLRFGDSLGVEPKRFPGLRLTTGADRAAISRLATLT